jgi:6-pyruvoyl-tetrahydropterin synthase
MEIVSVENHFVAHHRDTGDTKHHPHKYVVELSGEYTVADVNTAETLDDNLIVVLHDMNSADLNELFEREARYSFRAPSLVNVARYILWRIKDNLKVHPSMLNVTLTEIDEGNGNQRAVKMGVRM